MHVHGSALVVEDNLHMQVLLTEVLRELDLEHVDAVASLAEARACLDFMAYDLALIDVGLGEENGLDLIREIRCDPNHPQRRVPMIVVTGQNLSHVIRSARDAGADSFLTKPVTPSALQSRITQVLRERRKLVESDSYFGPDRRRGAKQDYDGPERRDRARTPSDST
jgi:CheY-like chemotaxis protein